MTEQFSTWSIVHSTQPGDSSASVAHCAVSVAAKLGLFNVKAPTTIEVLILGCVSCVANQGTLPRTAIKEATWDTCDYSRHPLPQ